jgi:hypothetical protein
MNQSASRAIELNPEHFPIYQLSDNATVVDQVSKYIKTLLDEKMNKHGGYVALPSLNRLSRFFKCSYLEVYDAIKFLRTQGYDYQFSSVDGLVQVWCTLNKEKSE